MIAARFSPAPQNLQQIFDQRAACSNASSTMPGASKAGRTIGDCLASFG
jgi:hypothetical protein